MNETFKISEVFTNRLALKLEIQSTSYTFHNSLLFLFYKSLGFEWNKLVDVTTIITFRGVFSEYEAHKVTYLIVFSTIDERYLVIHY